jgi:hypothetical protein
VIQAEAVFNSYRPEKHYMRGPGPKWRERHAHGEALDLASSDPRASPPLRRT